MQIFFDNQDIFDHIIFHLQQYFILKSREKDKSHTHLNLRKKTPHSYYKQNVRNSNVESWAL